MPEEKASKLGSAEAVAAESSKIGGAEHAESKPAKQKKRREVRRFNPHETARVDSLSGAPLATFKQRFIAYSIDFIIVGSLAAAAIALLNYLIVNVWHLQPNLYDATKEHVKIHANLELEKTNEFVEAIFVLFYFGLTVWLTNGLTLGKRIMKIRVVSLTHERITLWQSCERALGYGASALEAGFGFFQYFIYPNRTCVHDRIAETIVVQEPRVEKPRKDKKTKLK
jgi:uncharacterized RDD family membrane protein YckC